MWVRGVVMRMLASNTPVPVLAERNRIGHTNSNRATENKTDVQNSKKDVLLHRPSLLLINYEIASMDPTKLNLCIKISKNLPDYDPYNPIVSTPKRIPIASRLEDDDLATL